MFMLGLETLEKRLDAMRKREIYKDIQEYFEWKEKQSQTEHITDRDFLLLFAERVKGVRKLADIRVEHVKEFCATMNTLYETSKSIKSIRCFLRYHRARGRVCLNPHTLHVNGEQDYTGRFY